MELTAHGVGLTRPRLAVGKAGGHAALEDVLDQGPRRVPVHQLVAGSLVEDGVEAKVLVVQIFGQVHFGLGFVRNHL